MRETLYKLDVDLYNKRKEHYRQNLVKAYALLCGRCSLAIQNKISEEDKFETFDRKNYSIELLKTIRKLSLFQSGKIYLMTSL